MENGVFTGLNRRKLKVFFLFLTSAVLAWFLSNLSDSYESRTVFALNYRNLPDSLILGNNAKKSLEGKVRTSGFRLMYYNFFSKQLNVDLSQVLCQDGKYIIEKDALKKQVDKQLSQNVTLLDFDGEQWEVDLYQVAQKKIFINPNIELNFQPNHILEGKLKIVPDSITVKGPEGEISNLVEVKTEPIILENLSSNFSYDTKLRFPKGLDNTVFAENRARISGDVVKFSEKIFDVEVKALNAPEGYNVKMFPNKVSLVCKASLDQLKRMDSNSFEVTADYQQQGGASNNSLLLQVTKKPNAAYVVSLQQRTVNFVLEKK